MKSPLPTRSRSTFQDLPDTMTPVSFIWIILAIYYESCTSLNICPGELETQEGTFNLGIKLACLASFIILPGHLLCWCWAVHSKAKATLAVLQLSQKSVPQCNDQFAESSAVRECNPGLLAELAVLRLVL